MKTVLQDESRPKSMGTLQLPDDTCLSRMHLRTQDLARPLDFYQRVIGFKVFARGKPEASLSATGRAPSLLVFTEDPNASPRPLRATGLYHFAIRLPASCMVAGRICDSNKN